MSVLTLFDHGRPRTLPQGADLLGQLGLEHERVGIDIFASESQRRYQLLNPAGRTPALLLEDAARLPSRTRSALSRRGSRFRRRPSNAHVHQWLFFEQNGAERRLGAVLAPDEPRVAAARSVRAALQAGRMPSILDRGLTQEFLVEGRCTVADIALYAYTHVAHGAGIDIGLPGDRPWLEARRGGLTASPATSSPIPRTRRFRPADRRAVRRTAPTTLRLSYPGRIRALAPI